MPRILSIARDLTDDELRDIRTAADVYHLAFRKILNQVTAYADPSAWSVRRDEQRRHVRKLLAAIGFMFVCRTTGHGNVRNLNDEFVLDIGLLASRMSTPARQFDEEAILGDLRLLDRFASGIVSGLTAGSDDADGKGGVTWSNRTIPQFFAASWLSSWASDADCARMRHHVYFRIADFPEYVRLARSKDGPVILDGHATYELNLFLAGMPSSAPDFSYLRWIAAVSHWFDPGLFGGASAPRRIWPTEMMFRAWRRLNYCARQYSNWWNTPYDVIAAHPLGRERDERTPRWHAERDKGDEEEIAARASAVLDRFQGELDHTLAGLRGPALRADAEEMVAERLWSHVPSGRFRMGQPEQRERHGCQTAKPDAYWLRLLSGVRNGKESPSEAAERATWPEWFVGAHGTQFRNAEVEYLTQQFTPLVDGTTTVDEVLHHLKRKWHTTDETPQEDIQAIAAFDMHRYPLLIRWFNLFEPGHRDCARIYLADLEGHRAGGPRLKPDAVPVPAGRLPAGTLHYPDDGQPVTYVSWFDAWAFCQWAQWSAPDPGGSGARGVWCARLPHEPEWEFAAWGRVVPDGQVLRPDGWWWWGSNFYDTAHSEEERKTTPQAHADGRPTMTRAPADACPNGFGLHDMIGNVWEWMANPYDHRYEEEIAELEADFQIRYSRHEPREWPPPDVQRATRGGLWYYLNILATCTNRWRMPPTDCEFKRGFRLVREWRPT